VPILWYVHQFPFASPRKRWVVVPIGLIYDLLWRHRLLTYYRRYVVKKVETLTSRNSMTFWPRKVKLGIPVEERMKEIINLYIRTLHIYHSTMQTNATGWTPLTTHLISSSSTCRFDHVLILLLPLWARSRCIFHAMSAARCPTFRSTRSISADNVVPYRTLIRVRFNSYYTVYYLCSMPW